MAHRYSVYGNHDYGQYDRACGCDVVDLDGSRCGQVLKHHKGRTHNGQRWHLPAVSYFAAPLGDGVNLEVIGLDLNIPEPSLNLP